MSLNIVIKYLMTIYGRMSERFMRKWTLVKMANMVLLIKNSILLQFSIVFSIYFHFERYFVSKSVILLLLDQVCHALNPILVQSMKIKNSSKVQYMHYMHYGIHNFPYGVIQPPTSAKSECNEQFNVI